MFSRLKAAVTARQEQVDNELKELRKSLDAKRAARLAEMGTKWILHPDNHVRKVNIGAKAQNSEPN